MRAANKPSIMRPGPCLLPVRTKSGGLSTIEVNLGSSAACLDRRLTDRDIFLHSEHLLTKGSKGCIGTKRDSPQRYDFRKSDLEEFMTAVVFTPFSLEEILSYRISVAHEMSNFSLDFLIYMLPYVSQALSHKSDPLTRFYLNLARC